MPVIAWILQSRAACAALAIAAVLGGFFVWHKVDKSSAVRRAVVEYVADAELTAARVQLDELKWQPFSSIGGACDLHKALPT